METSNAFLPEHARYSQFHIKMRQCDNDIYMLYSSIIVESTSYFHFQNIFSSIPYKRKRKSLFCQYAFDCKPFCFLSMNNPSFIYILQSFQKLLWRLKKAQMAQNRSDQELQTRSYAISFWGPISGPIAIKVSPLKFRFHREVVVSSVGCISAFCYDTTQLSCYTCSSTCQIKPLKPNKSSTNCILIG